MAIGLGKRYWVRQVKYHYGDIDSCIKFMQENKPENNHMWFELFPCPHIDVKKDSATCDMYQCALVEKAK